MRFGFAVKVIGQGGNIGVIPAEGGLPSHDARRWQTQPHVRESIRLVTEVFEYMHKTGLNMYRMSSDFVPYSTHPDMPQFHNQLEEARAELAELGELARRYDIRLSLHPSQYILLNALEEGVAAKSIADLNAQARLLDSLGCGSEGVVVTHVGGVYGDRQTSIERFIRRWHELPEGTRARLVVENDDVSFSLAEVMHIHRETGCRVVFDNLHHFCLNPEGLSMREAFTAAMSTWPEGQTPKIHYSSPSTSFEPFEVEDKTDGKRLKKVAKLRAPKLRAHADFIDPMEFVLFWEAIGAAQARPFDIMLESKGKDVALLRLRQELARQTLSPSLRALII